MRHTLMELLFWHTNIWIGSWINWKSIGLDKQGILRYIKQVFGKTVKTYPNGNPQTRRLTDTEIRSILNKSTTLRNVTFLKKS